MDGVAIHIESRHEEIINTLKQGVTHHPNGLRTLTYKAFYNRSTVKMSKYR